MKSLVPTGYEAALQEAVTVRKETEAAADLAARTAAEAIVDSCGDGHLRVLTHCNTGWLTMGVGTGLGAITVLAEEDRLTEVLVSETRPLLQGARLSAWELGKAGIPYRLCTDNAAPAALSAGMIDCVVVGADRIAQNGDVANKIGTYSLALSAAAHDVPFIVVATEATLDRSLFHGGDIEIEQRHAREVTHVGDVAVAPTDARVYNPAFDVTPDHLTTAVITERGIFHGGGPLGEDLQEDNVSIQSTRTHGAARMSTEIQHSSTASAVEEAGKRPPAPVHSGGEADVVEVISSDALRRRIGELGQEISARYAGQELLMVGILKGAVIFCADLIREISVPSEIEFIEASSYGSGATSSGAIRIVKDVRASIEGRHVLIVEDIVDSGRTLSYLLRMLKARGPRTLTSCALLAKGRRLPPDLAVEYVGFHVPDRFMVGYGLDYAERFRNLDFVGALDV